MYLFGSLLAGHKLYKFLKKKLCRKSKIKGISNQLKQEEKKFQNNENQQAKIYTIKLKNKDRRQYFF